MTGFHSMNDGRPRPLDSIMGRAMGRFAQDEDAVLGWDYTGQPTEDSYMRPPELGLEPPRPLPWAGEAACKDNPGPWMAKPGEGQGEAIRICLTGCWVYDKCLAWSATDEAKFTGMVVAGIPPEREGPWVKDK